MRALRNRADELAKVYVDKMAAIGPECDFAQQVAVNYPLYMIMSLLGVPESDFPLMLKLTQELFGSDDDEFKRGADGEDQMSALLEMFEYFTALTASRRENPTEDLASAIANATIDGEPLSDIDTDLLLRDHRRRRARHHQRDHLGWHAGAHRESRSASTADRRSGPDAACDRGDDPLGHPRQGVHADRHRGHHCSRGADRAGESVLLSYVSGNRDEDVFDDPFRFDVTRDPNRHIAFGYGVHFCLGAALARMEVNSFFSELLPRLEVRRTGGRPAARRDDIRRRPQAPADPLFAALKRRRPPRELSEAAVSPDGLSDR